MIRLSKNHKSPLLKVYNDSIHNYRYHKTDALPRELQFYFHQFYDLFRRSQEWQIHYQIRCLILS